MIISWESERIAFNLVFMLHLTKCFDLLPLWQALVGMMDSAYFCAGWSDFMLPVSFMMLLEN